MKSHLLLHVFQTSVQQGGAPPCDGRPVPGGGARYHFEDVMAAGVQLAEQDVVHTGVLDGLHLERAVPALHLYGRDTRGSAVDRRCTNDAEPPM